MDGKRKAAVLACLGASIFLGLYRNFGVSVMRFWPLVLLDSLLRLPGDPILRLLDPRLPAFAHELLKGLFQAGTLLLLVVGGQELRAFRRKRRLAAGAQAGPSEIPKPKVKPRRRWLTVAGWTAFTLLLVNGRCSRGFVSMLSLFCGVDGYPIRVTTDVRVAGAPEDAPIGEEGRGSIAPRPAMWFFFEDADGLRRHESTTANLWRLISEPGVVSYGTIESSSKEDLRALIDETPRLTEPSDPSASRRKHSYVGGSAPSLIGANLDLFLDKAGGGWWREQAGGYLVAVGEALAERPKAPRADIHFPPSILHFDRLSDACRLIGDLTGTAIVDDVTDDGWPAAGWPDVSEIGGPGADLGRALGRWGSDGIQAGIHVEIDRHRPLREIVEAIARSRRWSVDEEGGRLIVRDLRADEIEPRVRSLFETRRSSTSSRYPDPSLALFPSGSSPFVTAYLDDPDDGIVRYALTVLEIVGVEPAVAELLNLMTSGATRSGRKISEGTRESAADILMKAGEPAALSYLERSNSLDREHISYWYADHVNVSPTAEALVIQDKLLARFGDHDPLVRAGKLRIRRLPPSLSASEAAAVERLALKAMNAFSGWDWDEDGTATLTFSADGSMANYHVELWHHWGPLAGGGASHFVELRNMGGRWLITRIWSHWGWMS